jgi:hypothetical protein
MFQNILNSVINVFSAGNIKGSSTSSMSNVEDGAIRPQISSASYSTTRSSGSSTGAGQKIIVTSYENEEQLDDKEQEYNTELSFKSQLPDTSISYDSIQNVQEYLDNFCRGGGGFGEFKGFCYVIEKSWKNSYKFCCDRGGGTGRANHMSNHSRSLHSSSRPRESTTRKTGCPVRIFANRINKDAINETPVWKLEMKEVGDYL